MTTSSLPDESTSRSDLRRRDVLEAARRVIVERGLEAASLRRIAGEAGFTTGFVNHYFPDKQSLVLACFQAVSAEWLGSVKERLGRAPEIEERLAVLVEMAIPDDPTRREEWRLWSEMWTYAGGNPEFANELVEEDARWERVIHELLAEAEQASLLAPGLDLAAEATILARLVDGLGLRAWLSGEWPQARERLVYHLTTLGVPQDRLAAPSERAG